MIRELRAIPGRSPRELTKVHRDVARQVVPLVVRAYARHFTSRTGRHVRMIRALASQKRASIAAGGARFPEFHGMEWGSKSGRFPQFGPRAKGGRFLFPTVREEVPERVIDGYEVALDGLLKRAFPERL